MAAPVPILTLNDGRKFPALGLGTWKSKPNQVYDAVKYAIKDAGYRHIDCAHVYQNEHEVGRALKELFDEGVVKREEVWITSKLWNTYHKKDVAAKALDVTLKNLQLDYLDLYLIHWPHGFKEGDELFPRDANGKVAHSDADPLDVWKIMIDFQKSGKVKSIGVSNFNIQQVDRIIKETGVVPAVNQVECHPYLPQNELLAHHKQHNIVITAYSPLGTPDRPWADDSTEPVLMNEPVLHEIAKKYNRPVADVLLKFHLKRNTAVIPKSVTPARIKVVDLDLSDEDVQTLQSLKNSFRYCSVKDLKDHPHYPFN